MSFYQPKGLKAPSTCDICGFTADSITETFPSPFIWRCFHPYLAAMAFLLNLLLGQIN